MINRRTLIATMLASTMLSAAFAANVPEGTQLAESQVFTYRLGDETTSFDPQLVEDFDGARIVADMFETLYVTDSKGAIVPAGALSHEVSEDKMIYTFKLRPEAMWSDGTPVTAADYVYGWQRAVDPELASPYSWYMEIMSVKNAAEIIAGDVAKEELGVKAIDDHTLEVTLSTPIPYFAKMVTMATTAPAPKATIEANGADWTKPENIVVNGAYKLSEHVLKERSTRVRNDKYWDNEHTVLDEVSVLIVNDENQAFTRYKAGELNMTDIPAGQFIGLKKEMPDEVFSAPNLGSYYYVLNQSENGPEAFKDARVRKALSYAVDRDVIVNNVKQAGEIPAYTFTPTATEGYVPPELDWANWTQAERDAKAKELLAEAGYGEGGKPLSFKLMYNTDDAHKAVAVVISQMWKQKLGVDVELENQEWKVFLESRGGQSFEMARGGWFGDYNEASTFLDLVTTDSGYNDGKYSNAEIDALMAEAKTLENGAANYTKVEEILSEESGVIPLYFYSKGYALNPTVKGWPYENIMQDWLSKDLYIIAE